MNDHVKDFKKFQPVPSGSTLLFLIFQPPTGPHLSLRHPETETETEIGGETMD